MMGTYATMITTRTRTPVSTFVCFAVIVSLCLLIG
jgi:hypothetical protein